MNYIFGNNSLLYSRTSRGGNSGSGQGLGGPKQRLWVKKGSAEALPDEPEPSSSRWQQIVAFFTRRHRFFDCISVAASSSQGRLLVRDVNLEQKRPRREGGIGAKASAEDSARVSVHKFQEGRLSVDH
uniref:Uncharacterized protein n=1 Tax=Sphaerodactylus townsendi TaxID=933632 RepID=A0ACB8FC14_9SAUR